jgi:hypothetical protein
VLSTPFTFVALDVFVTLLIGCLCGALSVRLAGVLTPKPRGASTSAPPERAAPA